MWTYLSATTFICVMKIRWKLVAGVSKLEFSLHCEIYILHDFVNSPLNEFVRMLFELKRLRDFVMLEISIDSTTLPHCSKFSGLFENVHRRLYN